MQALECDVEEKFCLQASTMNDKLSSLQQPMELSKVIYEHALQSVEKDEVYRKKIENIPVLRDPSLRQELGDFELLYAQATMNQEYCKGVLTNMFPDMTVQAPSVKGRERSEEKIKNSYGGDCSQIRDLSRFTIVCTSFQDLYNTYNALNGSGDKNKTFEIVQVKNKYASPDPMGYMDFNINVRVKLPNGQHHICEVQINLAAMIQAKAVAHQYYETIRSKIPKLHKSVFHELPESNIADLETFQSFILDRLHVPAIDVMVDKLAQKAEGLFQYVWLLEAEIKNRKEAHPETLVDFTDISAQPAGLRAMYELNFTRTFPDGPTGKKFRESKKLLAAICAGLELLPVALAEKVFEDENFHELQENLSLLCPVGVGDDRIHVIHKSVIDWLVGNAKEEGGAAERSTFAVVPDEILRAHRRLFRTCAKLTTELVNERSPDAAAEERRRREDYTYAVRHVVTHACEAKDAQCARHVRD